MFKFYIIMQTWRVIIWFYFDYATRVYSKDLYYAIVWRYSWAPLYIKLVSEKSSIVLVLGAKRRLYNEKITFKRFDMSYFKDKESVAVSYSSVPDISEEIQCKMF